MPKLVYRDPETDQEMSIELGVEMPEVTVGRNPGNVLRVNNPSISRRHAKIVFGEQGECVLHDLDSSNGSYINGNRVRSQSLTDGDRLRIGEFPLDFRDATDSATAEVSAEMIESVLQSQPGGAPHRQTHLGGFGAKSIDEALSGEQDDEGILAMDDLSFEPLDEVSDAGAFAIPPQPPSDSGFALEADSMGGAFSVPKNDESAPELFGDGPSIDDDTGVEPQGGFTHGDDDVLETGFEIELDQIFEEEELSDESLAEDDLDTKNAGPEEIAEGLAGFGSVAANPPNDEMTVEKSLAEVLAESRPQHDADMMAELARVQKERDELLDSLQNDSADASSKLQIERLRQERSRLTEERRSLLKQLNDFRSQLETAPDVEEFADAQRELEELRARVEVLDIDLSDAQEESSEKQSAIEGLQEKLEELEGALEAANSNLEGASSVNDQLSDVQEDLKGREAALEDASNSLSELQEQVQAANEEIESLGQTIAERDATIHAMREDLAAAEQELDQKDAQISEMQASIDANEVHVQELSADRDRIAGELAERPVAEEVSSLREEREGLQTQLDALSQSKSDLDAKHAELEKALLDSQDTLAAFTKRHEKIGLDFDQIKQERDSLKEERGAFARETDYLQVKRRKLSDELAEAKAKIKTFAKEERRKKAVFGELSKDLRGLVNDNNELNDKIAALEKAVEGAPEQEAFDALQEQVKALQASLDEVTKRAEESESDANDLTRDLGKYKEERDLATEKAEALETEVETLRASAEGVEEAAKATEELRGSLKEATAARDEFEAERNEFKDALEAATEEKQGLATELEKTQQELAQAKVAVAEATENAADADEVEKLKGHLKDAEASLAELILENDKLTDKLSKKK